MSKRKISLIFLLLLLLAGAAVLALSPDNECFTGSRVKNPDSYLLDIERMNGTDTHSLYLQEGDELRVIFKTEKGSLKMEIKAPDGTSIFQGNGRETSDFTVKVPSDGVYTLVVEARQARGTVSVKCEAKT